MTEQVLMVIGVLLVVCGLGALANPMFFRRTMGSFRSNPALVYLSGIVNIMLGLVLVMNHNVWNTTPAFIVSFFAWAALIRGAIMLLSPNFFLRVFKKVWMGSHLRGEAFFLIVIGLIFIYLAM